MVNLYVLSNNNSNNDDDNGNKALQLYEVGSFYFYFKDKELVAQSSF